MEWKWNHIRIEGNNNVVLQDADGQTTTIAIHAFIAQFTEKQDELIVALRGQLAEKDARLTDKENIVQLADTVQQHLQTNLQQAIEQKEQLEKRVTELLQEFNGKDIAQCSALYQEAFALFLNGNLLEALAVFDDAKLQASKAAFQKRQQQVAKEQQRLAETFLFKAQLLQLTFDFTNAAKQFAEAIDILPSYSTYFAAAYFHAKLNHFQEAQPLFQKALALASTPDEQATILNNLANLQSDNNDHAHALKNYNEALAIRRQLAAKNPDAYLPDVAATLNNLAILQSDNNDHANALKNFNEAFSTYRQLAAKNPDAYLPDVATTLINLGWFYHDSPQPDKQKSLECVQEALQILSPLVEKLPYVRQYVGSALKLLMTWGNMSPEELMEAMNAGKR